MTAASGLSSNGQWVYISHLLPSMSTSQLALQIDVWDTRSLSLVHTLSCEDLAQAVHFDNPKPECYLNFRGACFIADRFLAIATALGWVRVFSVTDGSLLAEAQLGGCVESLTCSSTHLAISNFPGPSGELTDACGIKVYEVEEILVRKEFRPTLLIDPETLGGLPYSIRFAGDGESIICQLGITSRDKIINKTAVYDFTTDRYDTVLQERATRIVHSLTNEADDGSYVIVGKRDLCWYNARHRPCGRCRRPTDLTGQVAARVSYDGQRAYIARGGQTYECMRSGAVRRVTSSTGTCRSLEPLPNGDVALATLRGSQYALALLNQETQGRVAQATASTVTSLVPDAFDVTREGRLCVGDCEGILRIFDAELRVLQHVPTKRGAAAQILSDPFHERVCLLTYQGAVLLFTPGETQPSVYTSRYTGNVLESGSGSTRCDLSQHPDFPLIAYKGHRPLAGGKVDRHRGVEANFVGGKCRLVIEDYDQDTWEESCYAECILKSPAWAMTMMRRNAILLLLDGQLVAMDPYSIEVVNEGSRRVFRWDGPGIVSIAQWIKHPRGVCALGDDRIAVWTDTQIILFEVSDDWQATNRNACDQCGVRNIKWDAANERLIVGFDNCVSVWTTQLERVCRLYVLSEGRHLIHVPYAGKRTGLDRMHPGFFWTDEKQWECLFEVSDSEGNVIVDEGRKRSFLQGYFSEALVRAAITDYERFRRGLDRSGRGLGETNLSYRLLPG